MSEIQDLVYPILITLLVMLGIWAVVHASTYPNFWSERSQDIVEKVEEINSIVFALSGITGAIVIACICLITYIKG